MIFNSENWIYCNAKVTRGILHVGCMGSVSVDYTLQASCNPSRDTKMKADDDRVEFAVL